MKNVILVFSLLFLSVLSFAQADSCINAISITPSLTNCNFQAGSSANATESMPSCSGGGNADDDVWYSFVANSSNTTITVDPTNGYDAVVEIFSGSCGSLTSLQCEDVNGQNGDEVLNIQTLSPGNTYYVRVYHFGAGSGTSTFNICVTGLSPANNDTPCNAFPLPVVTPSCNYEIYTNQGATDSGVETPSACGGSNPFQGGYAGGDVWFSVVVPPSGELDIHTLSVDFADGAMALYSGTCSSLTQVTCDDDDGPGFMPYIYQTGLTPGETMFIRVWEYGNNANGQFGICVSTPDNDDCATAQEICDLNGYGGITSSAYTIDQPSNMCGIGNPASPNPGCVFGTGYTGTSPVQIDNNSWLSFTASATTAELFVQVNYCSNGNGMQMQIFSGNNCTNFAAVSTFLETANSQTVTATGLTPGEQYYIVVDGFAGDICSYTISATSGVQVVEVTSANTSICLGDTTTLDAEVTGTGTYTYTWSSSPAGFSSSDPSVDVSPTVSTLYSVDITGLCGNVSTASIYVTVNDLPNTTISASDSAICLNQSINLNGNAAGGTPGYTHFWTGSGQPNLNSNSIETPVFSGNSSGPYTLSYVVTDTVGCEATDSIQLYVNDLPTPTISGIDTICIGDTTTLFASGGDGYVWNTTSTNDSIVVSPTSNTNYSVTVTDTNNCSSSTNADVIVHPLPTPSISGSTIICQGFSTQLTASGGNTYNWSTGATTDTITVSPSGDSTYIVTVANANGCSDTTSVTVQVLSQPSAVISGLDSICNGSSTTLYASGGGNYTWNDNSNLDSLVINPSVDSTFSLIVDINGCLDTSYHSITVNGLPTPTITGIDTICIGDTTTLFASGGAGYVWNTTSTNDSIIVSPNSNTNYSVTVTDTNNCSSSTNADVIVNPLPNPSISGSEVICQGFSTQLTASGGTTYNWSTGATTDTVTVSPSSDSTYIVTVTNANGCSDTTSVTVQVLSQPTAVISGLDSICNGSSTTLYASGGGNYTWNDNSNLDSLVINPSTDSTFSLIVDINGCLDTTYHTITVNELPSVFITGLNTICEGESTTLTATGGTSYIWDDNSTLDSVLVTPSSTTNYTVTATNEHSCSADASYSVNVNPLPIVTISGLDSVCEGTSTTLTASGATNYEWNTNETSTTITVNPNGTTTYSVIGYDGNNCSNSANFTVGIMSQPSVTITGDEVICDGGIASLTAAGANTYEWNTTETTASISVIPTDTANYQVIGFINGCSDTAQFTVNVADNPIIVVSPEDTLIYLGQTVTINTVSETPVFWTPSEGLSCDDCNSPVASPTETTLYCAQSIKNGCTSSACVTIEVENICGEVFVPDAFSPNGDGNNDCLKVYSNCLKELQFRVYSRWGELLYENTEIDACWNGTHNGKSLNTGVYAYTVSAILKDGEVVDIKGNVTLFK